MLDENFKNILPLLGLGVPVISEEMEASCPDEPDSTYEYMHQLFVKYGSRSSFAFYPFFRKSNGNVFVNLYIWFRHMDDSIGVSRYVFIPGYKLSGIHEESFLSVCREDGNITTDFELFQSFIEEIKSYIPSLVNREYKPGNPGRAIEEIYFMFFKRGPLECLYKAGLNNIGFHIAEIANVEFSGASPSEIVGGLPIKLLRCLNYHDLLTDQLYTERKVKRSLRVYEKYGNYICMDNPSNYPSKVQWSYLWKTITPTGPVFNKSVYRRLKSATSENVIVKYEQFLDMKRVIREKVSSQDSETSREIFKSNMSSYVPRCDVVEDHIRELEHIERSLDKGKECDKYLEKIDGNTEYFYENESYIAYTPISVAEICKESRRMCNCLAKYWEVIFDSHGTVVFVRDKRRPDKSLIDMEITSGKFVAQAYRPHNSIPTIPEMEFIEEYSKAKGFHFNPREIYRESCYSGDDALKNYILNHYPEPSVKKRYIEDFIELDVLDEELPIRAPLQPLLHRQPGVVYNPF